MLKTLLLFITILLTGCTAYKPTTKPFSPNNYYEGDKTTKIEYRNIYNDSATTFVEGLKKETSKPHMRALQLPLTNVITCTSGFLFPFTDESLYDNFSEWGEKEFYQFELGSEAELISCLKGKLISVVPNKPFGVIEGLDQIDTGAGVTLIYEVSLGFDDTKYRITYYNLSRIWQSFDHDVFYGFVNTDKKFYYVDFVEGRDYNVDKGVVLAKAGRTGSTPKVEGKYYASIKVEKWDNNRWIAVKLKTIFTK